MTTNNNFNFSFTLEVRLGDINYGGHLGNEMFILYLQEARMKYLQQFGFSEGNIGNNVGIILSELHCKYKNEAFYGEQLTVFLRISEMKGASFRMEYEIIRQKDEKLIAKAYSIQAAFDYQARRPVAIPKNFKEAILVFEKLI